MNRHLITNRWSPSLLGDFRNEMNRLMEGFFDSEESQSVFFAPRADFTETDKTYEVTLDLPGMKPEEVSIEFKEGHLWVSGERKQEAEEKGKTYHRIERNYGQFRRVIALGNDVNADGIEATYKNGVLSISLPKVEAVQPKRIEVKS